MSCLSGNNMPLRVTRSTAFSLIELLIVIAIIALLTAIIVPAANKVRTQTRRVVCASRLKQWGMALQYYRQDFNDYIPTEGHLGHLANDSVPGHEKRGTWYNELPEYLDMPAYKDTEGVNLQIKEFPSLNVWICPAKNLSIDYKSASGMNQFHYAMNQVLDGCGSGPSGGSTTPYFPDMGEDPLKASRFSHKPGTIFMFDVDWNSPAATPKHVATEYHKGIANILFLNGSVDRFHYEDIRKPNPYPLGEDLIVWYHPRLYWGYPPPGNWDCPIPIPGG